MKMSNPFVFPAKTNKNPRNAFDLSHHEYFTTSLGLLEPSLVMDLIPADYIEITPSYFTRTQTCNSAAFSRINEHVDYFAVPYRLLWRWWTEFVSNVGNSDSSYNPNGTAVPNDLPYMTGAEIKALLSNTSLIFSNVTLQDFFYRLLDQLGYPVAPTIADTIKLYDTGMPLNTKHFNVFRILAYFHIYNDFYRNSDFEANTPQLYNIDDLAENAAIPSTRFISKISSILPLKNWRKDYLSSIKPSPLYNSVAPKSLTPSIAGTDTVGNGSRTDLTVQVVQGDTDISFSAADIRNLIATEKLAQLSMLAPKTYEGQLQAHFGVKPDNCQYCSCTYLGSFDSKIGIDEVTSTAQTTEGKLGQLAGKGVGFNHGNIIKFNATEHCIVMGIHYMDLEPEYASSRLDLFNAKLSQNDFYQPEYDNLGMQPLTGAEFGGGPNAFGSNVQSLGWQPRYAEYKSCVNVCHGPFAKYGSEGKWGPLSYWASCRQLTSFEPKLLNKIYPNVLDSIFPVNFAGILTDQFLVHSYHNIKKVSNMSIYGLPQL